MKIKIKLLFVVLCCIDLLAFNQNQMLKDLNYSNQYLETNYKSDILAYIMIHYHELKLEENYNFTNQHSTKCLSFLLSKYKNLDFNKSINISKAVIINSTNPMELFNQLKSYTK